MLLNQLTVGGREFILPAHDVTDDKMKTYLRTTLDSLRITHTLISLTQETPIQS